MDYIKDIYRAASRALKRPVDWFVFFMIGVGIFVLFILIPVWTTPGNDVFFQLSLVSPAMYLLMTILAVLNGVVISMQLYIRRFNTQLRKATIGEKSSGVGAVTAAFFATLGCAACYSSVLALFGLGGSLLVAKYRFWIAGVAILLALIAIHLTAKRINGGCQACTIEKPEE